MKAATLEWPRRRAGEPCWRHGLLVVVLACSAARPVLAEAAAASDAPGPGDAELQAGDYAAALDTYDIRVAAGEQSAPLHYNMGLCAAHLGRLGWAVYHFTQAEYLEPGKAATADALALLDEQLREQRRDVQAGAALTRGEPERIFWLGFFNAVPGLFVDVALLASTWLGFGLLLWRRRLDSGGRRDAAFVAAVFALLLALGALTYRTGGRVTRASVVPGVVVVSNPILYEGPDRAARRTGDADLFEGAVVRVTDQREEWVGVELASGRTGWLAASTVRRVDVPAR